MKSKVINLGKRVTASMSGNHQIGFTNDATGENVATTGTTVSYSLDMITDGGIGISTGFNLVNNGYGDGVDEGLTLTFTDGSKLDLIEAGNAAKTHSVKTPGRDGIQGTAGDIGNNVPSGLDFGEVNNSVGFEYHSAADAFGIDGLTVGASASKDSSTKPAKEDNDGGGFAIGATYVTTMGNTEVTFGTAFSKQDKYLAAADASPASDTGMHVGFSAVTGDLTFGVGYSDGERVKKTAAEVDSTMITAGVQYVSGDITYIIGLVKTDEETTPPTGAQTTVTSDTTNLEISYAVTEGVTGYLQVNNQDNKAADGTSTDGTSWYVGATVSF